MVQPETYKGYDKDGKVIVTKTAIDATTLLDPSQVKAAVEEVINVTRTNSERIFSKLLQADASGKRAIVVSDADMSEVFNQVESEIRKVPGIVEDALQNIPSEAEQTRDLLQNNANIEAQNACATTAGVQTVGY